MADVVRSRVREREPGADKPCKWIAFIYKPLHDEVASYIEQREPSPEWRG